MFQVNKRALGNWEVWDFQTPNATTGFSVIPERGACLLQVRLHGEELLDGYTTPKEIRELEWMKSALLFPFPNRLRNGAWSWNGHTYSFPINEKSTNTALHGFGYTQPFKPEVATLDDDNAAFELAFDYDGSMAGYPFPFYLEVIYQIHAKGTFQVQLRVFSQAKETFPIGLGWHPYFDLGGKIGAYELKLPPCSKVLIDDQMVPTGELKTFDGFTQKSHLGPTRLDNCFVLHPAEGKAIVEVDGPKGNLSYWQETGPDRYNYLQLFTPPDGRSIAIEPMTCNIDALNNQQGLILLEPGAAVDLTCGLEFALV